MYFRYCLDLIYESYLPQIEYFSHCLTEKVLPAFQDLDSEADLRAQQVFDKYMSQPCGPDGPDFEPGDYAELAEEKGVEWYMAMTNMVQGMKNLFVVGLFHTYEQQFVSLYRHGIISEEDFNKPFSERYPSAFRNTRDKLLEIHINIEDINGRKTIQELEFAANTIKHAEGTSSNMLKEINPRLFQSPYLQGLKFLKSPPNTSIPIHMPLYGEDIYIREDDFKRYADAIKAFWNDLANKIEDHLG